MPATETSLFNRARLLNQLERTAVWDVVVIGGGATGLGIAVDAASRGYRTLLLERSDFAKGTSSRSTKLVHGGVRYLAQGNIPLVYSALKERGLLLKNAPHLVHKQAFIIPCYRWGDVVKYLTGLKIYDALAGRLSFGRSTFLNKKNVLAQLPGIREKGLKGGVRYFDGQFDDARLAINLAQTAVENGAVVLNYMEVRRLVKVGGTTTGVIVRDTETGTEYAISASVVMNATGVFADAVHQMDNAGRKPMLRQSQGVHVVIDGSKLPGKAALMIPETPDGRVLFAIPWHGQIVVGTTDTPVETQSVEPQPSSAEIRFILDTLNQFTQTKVGEADIQSIFAGLRPLVLPQKEVVSTKELSRDHKIVVSGSGLLSVLGGKWTTYRKMAEDAVDTAIKAGKLVPKKSATKDLPIHGFTTDTQGHHLGNYGSDAMGILKSWDEQPGGKKQLHPNYPYTEAEVLWAVQYECARTVEDVLARRVRLLFLDAEAAIAAAPRVASLLRNALNQDVPWEREQVQQFTELAKQYIFSENDAIHATILLPTIKNTHA